MNMELVDGPNLKSWLSDSRRSTNWGEFTSIASFFEPDMSGSATTSSSSDASPQTTQSGNGGKGNFRCWDEIPRSKMHFDTEYGWFWWDRVEFEWMRQLVKGVHAMHKKVGSWGVSSHRSVHYPVPRREVSLREFFRLSRASCIAT